MIPQKQEPPRFPAGVLKSWIVVRSEVATGAEDAAEHVGRLAAGRVSSAVNRIQPTAVRLEPEPNGFDAEIEFRYRRPDQVSLNLVDLAARKVADSVGDSG